jgi:pyridoxamine 5'-phosphate oxidase
VDELRLAEMRQAYQRAGLAEADLAPDPFTQFRRWLADVVQAAFVEPNATVLATAGTNGAPSARTVLLKGVDSSGFVFFSNYMSRKGRQIAESPRASLLFPWHPIARQVEVGGVVERLGAEESAAYWATRPRGSQLGAWASRQSSVVASRDVLEERLARLTERYADRPVPPPDFWGGYRVVPETVEFWQGRADRMHDRLRYRRDGDVWVVERLAP